MENTNTQPQTENRDDTHPQPDHLDSLLPALADTERRQIITHLQATPTNTLTLEDLTTTLATDYDYNPEPTKISLHHAHLPRLDDTGIIDYDPDTQTIAYHGHPELETLLDTIHTHDAP